VAEPVEVEVHGYEELIEGSEQLFERIEEKANDRFELVADKVASTARWRVPRQTGALAASIAVERRGASVLVGIGDADTPYAGWIEFGGGREGRGGGVAERPYIPRGRYLYPVAVSAAPVLVAAATDVAEDEIRRFPWRKPTP
jgi:Bacteriophage HK97-gp10, putative tail-component